MSRRVFVVVSVVVMSTLACLAGGTTPQGGEELPGISPIPEAPTESSPEGVCQGNRWRIVPLAVHQYPAEDGWKILLLPLAVENHSEVWGRISSPPNLWDAVVVSEGGYSYGIYDGNYVRLPEDASFPFWPTGEDGLFRLHSKIRIFELLPPGFSARGDNFVDGGGPNYWGEPNSWSHLVFQVAESQNHFKLIIPDLSLNCVTADGQNGWEQLGPIVLDLDTDLPVVTYPIADAKTVVQDISAPFEFGGASLQISKVYRENTWFGDETGDLVVIEFQVANLSGGYEASGIIRSYLIGDDGLIRFPGCGISGCGQGLPGSTLGFQVGPSQTGVASIGFVAPRSVGNLKFVIADEREGVFWVSDLPDDL